jgi:phage repressor protein C with HTH and peptisase S24 domain
MFYFRKVTGDSMSPTLKDGKIVWVHQLRNFSVGQVVIAFVDGREVVKRISKISNKGVELVSDNDKHSSGQAYARIPDKDIHGVVFWPRV